MLCSIIWQVLQLEYSLTCFKSYFNKWKKLSIGIDFGIGIDQNSWYRYRYRYRPKKLVSPITTCLLPSCIILIAVTVPFSKMFPSFKSLNLLKKGLESPGEVLEFHVYQRVDTLTLIRAKQSTSSYSAPLICMFFVTMFLKLISSEGSLPTPGEGGEVLLSESR